LKSILRGRKNVAVLGLILQSHLIIYVNAQKFVSVIFCYICNLFKNFSKTVKLFFSNVIFCKVPASLLKFKVMHFGPIKMIKPEIVLL